jgi:hypothetical protein
MPTAKRRRRMDIPVQSPDLGKPVAAAAMSGMPDTPSPPMPGDHFTYLANVNIRLAVVLLFLKAKRRCDLSSLHGNL